MKKILVFIIVFYIALIALMPKINLWYTLENYIKDKKIVIDEKIVSDQWFWLNIDQAVFLFDGLKSANIENIKIYPLLAYNKVVVKNITAGQDVKNVFNFNAEELTLQYSIRDIKHLFIASHGDFGKIEGSVDLMEQKINVKLIPSKAFESNKFLLQTFKKTKEGYIYESSLK